MVDYPVSIAFTGAFDENSIDMDIVELPALPDDIVARVDQRWAYETELNPDLVSGPLLSPVSVTKAGDRIELKCGVIDYKTFMGTTSDPSIPEKYRRRAVGVSAVTISADGHVLLGVRSPRIDWGTLRHVLPAGRLKPSDHSVFRGIAIEFEEELGVTVEADIESLVCIGVVRSEVWGRLSDDFLFLAHSRLSAADLIERAAGAESSAEHCQIEPFVWTPEQIGLLLNADPTGFAPTGWAALALCLRREFGDGAFSEWRSKHTTYEAHMGRRLDMIGTAKEKSR